MLDVSAEDQHMQVHNAAGRGSTSSRTGRRRESLREQQ